jgi:hypothetical protein
MKQPKKWWAATDYQQRRDRCKRHYNYNPPDAWLHERYAWGSERAKTRTLLKRLAEGNDGAELLLPYHHLHWLKWWYH